MMKNYLIDRNVVLMTNEYDQYGKLCARIMAGDKSFLIERTAVQLLDDSLKYVGFDLKGALNGAKFILGNRHMVPIMVNPYQGICMFPSRSPLKKDCIWFNRDHIVNTKGLGLNTKVELSNGYSIMVDSKLCYFNNKMQIADLLKRISIERGTNPNLAIFSLEPKKTSLFTKGKTGHYNFEALEKEIG